MSEITERSNVVAINEVPSVPEVHASMVHLGSLTSMPSMMDLANDIADFCPAHIATAIRATHRGVSVANTRSSISSPLHARQQFTKSLTAVRSTCRLKGMSQVEAKKTSWLTALSTLDLKVTDVDSARNDIKKVLQATTIKEANVAFVTVMNNLETSHTRVYLNNLASACATASKQTGFKQVEVKPVQGNLEIIATNEAGQRLISEVNIDRKSGQVDVTTETIGITDGSCQPVMKRFNDELKKMGIKTSSEKTTFTGGACRLSYAKIIDRQDKEAKQKEAAELKRRRMNNTRSQQRA